MYADDETSHARHIFEGVGHCVDDLPLLTQVIFETTTPQLFDQSPLMRQCAGGDVGSLKLPGERTQVSMVYAEFHERCRNPHRGTRVPRRHRLAAAPAVRGDSVKVSSSA